MGGVRGDGGWFVPGDEDMFEWSAPRCEWLSLASAAATFRQAQRPRAQDPMPDAGASSDAGGAGGGSAGPGCACADGHVHRAATKDSCSELRCSEVHTRCKQVGRIAIAGTSRGRGLMYALAAALGRASGGTWAVAREKHSAWQSVLPDPPAPVVDYYPLHGSVFSHFFRQRGVKDLRVGPLRSRAQTPNPKPNP